MCATSLINYIGLELLAAVGGKNGCGLDVIKVRKITFQIGVAVTLNAALSRPATARSAFAIFAVNFVHDVHSFGHFTERRETLPVEAGVVAEVDEQLCGARVWAGVAKVMVPRVLLPLTGSSGIVASRHFAETFGSPWMPNWHMKPGITRKKAMS